MLSVIALTLCPFAVPVAQEEDRAALEAKFEQLLTGAKLVGSFTLSNDPSGGLHKDSYTIQRVSKVDDRLWRFEALVEYGENSIPIALSLPVEWAGSTPVISITEFQFPMMGTYSAYVLFDGDQYAGVWSGKDYGGHMFGSVERIEAEEEEPAAEEEEEQETGMNWPSFRGYRGRGVAEGYPTATEWNVETGKNVKYRVELPGMAHSSPVIWGDRLFVTTAVRLDGEQELKVGLYGSIAPVEDEGEFGFLLYGIDKESGEIVWEEMLWEGEPAVKRHPKGSHAAASPATDGKRVVAFLGSEGLYCYDMDGNLQWTKSFGLLDSAYFMVPDAQWGFAASPVLHDDKVIVQCDVLGESFVAALDAKDGREIWRTVREEEPGWSTPTIHTNGGRTQVICNGWKHIGGYDFSDGRELWKVEGGGDIPVPTPVVSHDLIFITNAHGRYSPILAIATDAGGEFSMKADESDHMVWSYERGGNYMQTPIAYGEELYCSNDAGILSVYDVTTGEQVYRERLGEGRSGFTSSGVAADGKVYFTSEEGLVYVVRAGRDFEILAKNDLDEEHMSSPAISEGVLYFRTRGHLVAVGTAEQ